MDRAHTPEYLMKLASASMKQGSFWDLDEGGC